MAPSRSPKADQTPLPSKNPLSRIKVHSPQEAGGRPRALSGQLRKPQPFETRRDRDDILRLASLPRESPEGSVEMSDASKAIQALRQARDAGIARVAELTEKMLSANDMIEDLRDAKELAELERDASLERLMTAQAEVRELREKFEKLSSSNDAATGLFADKCAESLAKDRHHAIAEAIEGEAKYRQQETVARLIDQFGEERRKLHAELENLRTSSSVQIAALHAQFAAHARDSLAAADAERQRLDIATLRVELDVVREELQVARRFEIQPPIEAEIPVEDLDGTVDPVPGPHLEPEDVISELAAIDWYVTEVERDLSHPESLDVLASLFRDFADRGRLTGSMAVHRVAAACADVSVWLRNTPLKIPASLPLLKEGRNLIGRLLEEGVAATILDSGGSQVYAVDNDADNCECIVMALEKASFRTRYATKAEVAFRDISSGPVDLIILDVDLGDTDGFFLHQIIREVEFHAETPVIFVSGLYSTRERLAELPGPPASFVAKPYNLNELVLKALCTVLTSRLNRLQVT
jgi:CheY-like chemotaxis protein